MFNSKPNCCYSIFRDRNISLMHSIVYDVSRMSIEGFKNYIDWNLCHDFILKYLIKVTKFCSFECFESL